ncbi:GNAT family N-acetyltransferase [Erysipelothrix sp. HDW6C]|uniref:GNAT family N-acetyltransferase n=1 Tax=Erysipelothrix sp. HDW6C TaxID=2714930 RepID=UPI00140728AB|nr:GNAT family N-acetyltransferase [Erysipelothrix sp. HDW6C]QIK70219.1 GNAT family N-acetyltransferase [Erysipelothrix sp. HDW6C]
MKIVPLLRNEYDGKPLEFRYTTSHYYDIESAEDALFDMRIVRKPFEVSQAKSFNAELFPDYIENPQVFVIRDKDLIVAYLEIGSESWHNRLRISALLVDEKYRGRGYAGALLEYAKQHALQEGYREVVLETQSCNDPAIKAYLKHGFKIKGLDLTHYSNEDIAAKEVRIEMMAAIQ